MTQSVAPDQKNVFVTLRMITDADGLPATGVVAATTGHLIEYRRDLAAVVTDSAAAADLAALTTAHTDWEFLHIFDGYYTVAIPDAAFLKGVGKVLVNMRADGISGVAESVDIDPLIKFNGKASSVTAGTTTFPAGTTPKKGDEIYVREGTGERQTRLITSVAGEVASHADWDTNISATTSTIVLIPGSEVLADGGILVDVAVSSRSTVTPAQVNAECDTAISDVFNFAVTGEVDSNVKSANDTPWIGTGIASNKFRGNP